MLFHPRMQSRIEGFVVTDDLRSRAWNGVIADVWNVDCAPGAGGEYVSESPRLFVVLDPAPQQIEIGVTPILRPLSDALAGRSISYIPAGVRAWSHLGAATQLTHLDLHFDLSALVGRFSETIDSDMLETPRLMFADERLMALSRLVAAQCGTTMPLHDLYGDSLALAIFVELFGIIQPRERKRSQLSPWQRRRVIDFIEENCLRNIRLQELADIAGLSQSYFSHAFKASTGMAPHQWQMKLRIGKVQQLLLRPEGSLTHVANLAGFADQAHFTRVFKQYVGLTPAAWRRASATHANIGSVGAFDSSKTYNPAK